MSENLKVLTIRGIFFSGLSSIIVRLLSFITTLILSRILSPYDFGLMGQGILFINICMILNDLGLSTALVYQKEDLEKSANTALFLVLPAGILLTILTYFSAPLIAHFFKENSLLEITRILSLTIFISALAGIFNAILNKKMYFKKLLIPEIAPVLLYSFFTILLARLNFGVWSLVYGYFMQVLINFLLTYFSSNFKFKLIFDKKLAFLMLNYGKEVILTSIILYFALQGDNLFCGKFLGTNMLGFYALAYNISSLPSSAISQILGKVAFPLYSKLQEDKVKLKEAFLNFFLLNIILILPISLGIYILAYPLIISVLGIKWMPMLGVLKILCIFGFLRSLGGIMGVVFNSLGRPGELKKLVLIHVIFMSISIFPLGLKWGIEGVGISVVISQFISIYFAFIKLRKLINFNWGEIFKINLIPFSASFLLGIFLVILKYFIKNTLLNFLIIIISGSIFYLGLIYLFKKEWYFKIWNLIKGLEF